MFNPRCPKCASELAPLLVLEWECWNGACFWFLKEYYLQEGFSARILGADNTEVSQEIFPWDVECCILKYSPIGRAAAYVADEAVGVVSFYPHGA